MAGELAGKVAIVTGGAGAIGSGAVELFVAEGAKVVIADLDEARGTALADRLGPAVRFRRTDVAKRDENQQLVDFAVAEFGGLQIMFNLAGYIENYFGSLIDHEFDGFTRMFEVNLFGTMVGTQLAARHMMANGGGSIINTSSMGALRAGHGFSMYRASKAGVSTFTQCAAIELGEHRIRVNAICPGNITSDIVSYTAPLPGKSAAESDRLQDEISALRLARQPLKRQGLPVDVAQMAVFLGSDRSSYVTGQLLTVDGGATAGDAQSLIQQIVDARAAALA